MRARDSQDDSTEKEKSAASDEQKGGLFGSVQLQPATDAPDVPSPKVPGISVPSLEEARAELDRIRAQNAQNAASGQPSGLFRRDKAPEDETARQAPRASENADSTHESVSFGAVSLPPRNADEAPAQAPEAEPTMPASVSSPVSGSVFREETQDVPSADKPFRVPLLSQFVDSNETPATGAILDAPPIAATPPESILEQIVYAPASPEHPNVARTESQVVAPEIAPVTETVRPAETSISAVETAPTMEAMPVASAAPVEERPAPRPSNPSNMTPFQRLMAARAAQSGPTIPRPRNDRPAPRPIAEVVAPVAEAPAPIAEVEAVAPKAEAPAPENVAETPVIASLPVELPQEIAPQVETPAVELSGAQVPQTEVAQLEAPPMPDAVAAVGAFPVPDAQTQSPQENQEASEEAPFAETSDSAPETSDSAPDSEFSAPELENSAPELENSAPELENSAPDSENSAPETSDSALDSETLRAENSVGEASVVQSSAPMPELETPQLPGETAMSAMPEPPSQMEEMASKVEQMVAQARAPKDGAPVAPEAVAQEAEIVPEDVSAVTSSPDAASPSEMPNSEIAEPSARPALSLAERLARTPRAELDAAHAEAEALTPEILENAPTQRAVAAPAEAPARPTASLSFAERLAARNKPRIEEPPAPTAATPVEPSFAAPAPKAPTPQNADETPAVPTSALAAPVAPAPEPRRNEPRSFSERLAARTSLDRHLQVPAPESAPVSQDLATHNTELARINEGAELSEREMKNRVLFRQKHLIFDAVLGSLDQRTLQNPTREIIKPQVEKGVDAALREFGLKLEQSERNWLVDEFTREVTDLGALVPMLEDPSVSKIVVTGANDVSVERLGRIERTGVSFRDDDHLLSLVRRIAELSGGRVDAKVPLLDRPLPDGGRIRAKVPPLAPQPTLTIEKSTGNPFVVLKRQMAEKSRGDALPYAQLRERIQQRLLREFEGDAAALAGDQDKLRLQVEEMIGSVIAEEHVAVTRAERASLVMDLLNEIVGLGPIEPLLNDPDVDEVMVNGPYQIYVERKGKLELTSQRFRDNAHVMQVIDRIVAPLGRRVDEKSPMVDGRLRDGSRFNAIIPPLALSGPTMTIRKFARDPFTMSDLINFGTITREAAQFLQAAVEGRLNVVVSGGTGSGKTTTLNVLSSFIPSTERIVTIEDAAELQMRQEHVIRMETRPANIEGVGEVSIRDLVKNSLRMRPDRIVVGECRGGEALDMLQAMNTGHDGSLTTAHSNGPRDTCKRLETMVMMAGFDLPVRAIREQISMAVQLVVHQERMRDGKRRVTAVTEIVGMEGDVLTMQDIFRFEQEGMDDDGRIIGTLQATGMRPKYYETIVDNGGTISMDIFTPKAHEATPRARINERGGR